MALVVIKVWIYSIDSIANNHLGEDNAQNRKVESDEQKIDCQVPHDNQRSWRFPWSRDCLSSEQGRVGRLRETTHKVSFYCFIFIQIAFAFLPFIFFWGSRTFARIIGTFRIRWSVDMIKSHSPSNRIWSGYKKQQKIRVLSKIKQNAGTPTVALSRCQWQMWRRMDTRQNETTEWESWWKFWNLQIWNPDEFAHFSLDQKSIFMRTTLVLTYLLPKSLGESPCPSTIAGQGGHQDFHETREPPFESHISILKSNNFAAHVRCFSLKSKLALKRPYWKSRTKEKTNIVLKTEDEG